MEGVDISEYHTESYKSWLKNLDVVDPGLEGIYASTLQLVR